MAPHHVNVIDDPDPAYVLFVEGYRGSLDEGARVLYDGLTITQQRNVVEGAWRMLEPQQQRETYTIIRDAMEKLGITMRQAARQLTHAFEAFPDALPNCRCIIIPGATTDSDEGQSA